MTASEAVALGAYLQKGGFVIVDDFRPQRFRGAFGDEPGASGWPAFASAMKRVDPEMRFFDMDASHPIFHAFFEIDRLDGTPQNIGCPPM